MNTSLHICDNSCVTMLVQRCETRSLMASGVEGILLLQILRLPKPSVTDSEEFDGDRYRQEVGRVSKTSTWLLQTLRQGLGRILHRSEVLFRFLPAISVFGTEDKSAFGVERTSDGCCFGDAISVSSCSTTNRRGVRTRRRPRCHSLYQARRRVLHSDIAPRWGGKRNDPHHTTRPALRRLVLASSKVRGSDVLS